MFTNYGYCPICEKPVQFIASTDWWRDSYICQECQSIPRERALMSVIQKYFPNWKELLIHESSPENRGLSKKLKNLCPGYKDSQYYPNQPTGITINNFRNENLEKQTWDDNIFDIVITQDVFEHVYYPDQAFKEIARTLKPGGAHIFTVPLVKKNSISEPRIKITETGIENVKEPIYHGNPISSDGSLVTYEWGYDIVNFIYTHSQLTSTIFSIENIEHGIKAELNEVIISRKI